MCQKQWGVIIGGGAIYGRNTVYGSSFNGTGSLHLVYINTNIGIFIFLNVAPSQNLVFAPDALIRIYTVYLGIIQYDISLACYCSYLFLLN